MFSHSLSQDALLGNSHFSGARSSRLGNHKSGLEAALHQLADLQDRVAHLEAVYLQDRSPQPGGILNVAESGCV
jgi:hypothetical protein